MKKQRSYEWVSRLDPILNAVLEIPGEARPVIGYDALERKVNIRVEAPELKAPIQGSMELGEGFYSAKVTVGYLKELAYREDIQHIHAVNRSRKH